MFIGIGSNIDPEDNLEACAGLLEDTWPSIEFSSVYRSDPLEEEDQEEFLNAVARIDTDDSLQQIRTVLQTIEKALKKSPPYRFGPRTIDLDILLYGDEIIESNDLTVPHPRMHERRFVLEPLCELIDPEEVHPALGESWASLFEETEDQGCMKTTIEL